MKVDIRRIETTTSTNDDVKKAAETGAVEGLVVWAKTQTSGRGRQGRLWQSPEGNLYFSVLLRPPAPKRAWGNYSFVASLAIADAVRSFLPDAKIELKWTNDVLVSGKKISGILLEAGEGWLVVGIGLNVLHVPETPLYPATSLAAEKTIVIPAKAGIQRSASARRISQSAFDLETILKKNLDSLATWYDKMNASGFAPIRTAWLSRARKGSMRVRLPADKGELIGEFMDLDAEGNLHLRLPDGTEHKISAGDVF
jgi:BirA family transcriptional regulator, biotin operon repressor / biotin---[acetyl-CoA-carboxylase] ligase